MRTTPAVIGALLVLSGSRTVDAETCLPRAKLDGDAPIVAKVSVELRRLNVTIALPTDRTACPTIEATVATENDGIAVAIRDRSNRTEGRVVTDAALAASWIDSWVHDENELAEPAIPESSIALAPPSDTRPSVRAGAPAPTLLDRLTVAATYERSYSDDSETWDGGSVAACIHVGRVCIGARVRGAKHSIDTSFFAPDMMTPQTIERSDLAGLATASVSLHTGQMILSPEIGLGVGRLGTDRPTACKVTPEPNPGCDPNTDPTCNMMPPPDPMDPSGPPVETCIDASGNLTTPPTISTAVWTPRAAAAMRVAISLFDHVWLDATASITYSPYGASETMDPATGLAVSADPLTTWHLGIGLRIGEP